MPQADNELDIDVKSEQNKNVKQDTDLLESSNLHFTMRLRLVNERPFFGPGAAQLLSLIDKTNSVHLACLQMGISYSKGWKILRVMEEQTGKALTFRKQGGKNGGEAQLTQDGHELLDKFRAFEEKCTAFVQKEFDNAFSKWI